MAEKKFLNKIKEAFSSPKHLDRAAQGIVPTVLVIAGFAVATILAVSWIGNSILLKASEEANCIAQVEETSNLNGDPNLECIGADQTGANVIKNQINNQKGGRF